MLGKGVGLVQLIARARERALVGRQIEQWLIDVSQCEPFQADECRGMAGVIAEDVVRLAEQGQFLSAERRATDAGDVVVYAEETWSLDDTPAWDMFHEIVTLAERIDSFLAVVEQVQRDAPLARDCRHELDLLCVLADWCHDAGRAQVAEEARHLHALACSLYRE
jgi:hypothetical protein